MSESKLVKKTLTNTDVYPRVWIGLQRADDRVTDGVTVAVAGATLELSPGESAVVLVPEDFDDPWLKEAKVGAPKKEPSKKEVSLSEMQKEG